MLSPAFKINQEINSAFIRSAQDHVVTLHCNKTAKGKITIAEHKKGIWSERTYPLSALPDAVNEYVGRTDVYVTQNRFYGRRRVVNLAQLDAMYVDLDYYHAGITQEPGFVMEAALLRLEDARLPRPSLVIGSGRGLYLIWLHTPVPRQATPRWRLCQQILHATLKDLGADPKAQDAARVLRLVGTENSKSKTLVEALTPTGEVFDFDTLFDEIAPKTRADIYYMRFERAKRKKNESVGTQDEKTGFAKIENRLTSGVLWENRLSALQYWRQDIKQLQQLPPGERDAWMFWTANATAWLVPSLVLRREMFELAEQVASWSESESKQRLYAVLNRAHAMERGETIEWDGKRYSMLYRAREEKIAEDVGITEAERWMIYDHFGKPILCNHEIQKDYHKNLVKNIRRTSGAKERSEYEAERKKASEIKAEEAKKLFEQGWTNQEIAKELMMSKRQIIRLRMG